MDCQEIHDSQMCPVCSSETFAYISRWVPAPERRTTARQPVDEHVETYRQLLSGEPTPPAAVRWLKRGVFGFAAVSAAAWAWNRSGGPSNASATDSKPDGSAPAASPSDWADTVKFDNKG
jgi:hypothetical protein